MKSIGSDSEIPPSPYVGTIMGSIAEEGVDENIDLIGLSGFAAYCLWTIRRAAIHGDGNSDDRHNRCLDAHANGDDYSHEHTHSHNDEQPHTHIHPNNNRHCQQYSITIPYA
jgi:hypothetical protein